MSIVNVVIIKNVL